MTYTDCIMFKIVNGPIRHKALYYLIYTLLVLLLKSHFLFTITDNKFCKNYYKMVKMSRKNAEERVFLLFLILINSLQLSFKSAVILASHQH